MPEPTIPTGTLESVTIEDAAARLLSPAQRRAVLDLAGIHPRLRIRCRYHLGEFHLDGLDGQTVEEQTVVIIAHARAIAAAIRQFREAVGRLAHMQL